MKKKYGHGDKHEINRKIVYLFIYLKFNKYYLYKFTQ